MKIINLLSKLNHKLNVLFDADTYQLQQEWENEH